MTVVTDYETNLTLGVLDAAAAHDANVLIITGEELERGPSGAWARPQNAIYGLAGKAAVDGLVIGYSAIGSRIAPQEMDRFCSSYAPLPVSLVGPARAGFPCGTSDNSAGIKELVLHLARDHRRKRFGFIRGLAGTDGDLRYEAFKEALAEAGLPFDQTLVHQGDWSVESGKAAAQAFLSSGHDFDALMAANDHMAFGAATELMDRGKWVGKDISITGFDDTEAAMAFNPPLTTVRQQIRELARNAAESLFDILEGRAAPAERRTPTQTVLRRSCGCQLDSLKARELESTGEGGKAARVTLEEAFRKAIAAGDAGHGEFLGFLEMQLVMALERGEDMEAWRKGLRDLFPIAYRLAPAARAAAEALLATSELVIRELQNRELHASQVDRAKQERKLRRIIQAMGATFDMTELRSVLDRDLEGVGIPGYMVAEWIEGSGRQSLRPLMAKLSGATLVSPEADAAPYPAAEIFPRSFRPSERWVAVASPLCFGGKDLGIAVLEWGVKSGAPYDAVLRQLESSLAGASLLSSARCGEAELAEKNRRVKGLVLPMLESIDRVTTVVKERLEGTRSIAQQAAESAKRMGTTDKLVSDIGSSIDQMAQIIRIIEDISVNVHLLSFNASIEAAHAGQYGKGFAVIAKEIKKMAASTQEQSDQVSRELQSLIALIKSAAESARGSMESFQAQEASVKSMTRALDETASALFELDLSSKNILSVMGS